MPVNIYSNLPGDGLEPEEVKLYNLVNEYRVQNGLPPIPASKALTTVANRHVQDVVENLQIQDDDSRNPHSWSDGVYDPNNQSTWPSMFTAPQRLNTGYPGNGYENFYGSAAGSLTAEEALQSWKNSPSHNEVILNQGIWQNYPWNAFGIGIYKGYAALWFGKEVDPTGTPSGGAPPPPSPDQGMGDDSNQALTGSTGNDTIVALGGNDTINCGAGDDYANGNLDSDIVDGGEGNDYILGGQQDDIVIGGVGNDLMVNGNKGNDQVFGGEGDDTVHGGQNDDICQGEAGNDYLSGDLGVDILIGGEGSDIYVLRGDAADIVYYDDAEDYMGLSDGLTFANLSIIQGFDEYIQDGQIETQLVNATTGQLLAVLPGVDVSLIDAGDFLSV